MADVEKGKTSGNFFNREWPDFFPHDVPPGEACPAQGSAFRLVKVIPPAESDFLSTFEETPDRMYGDSFWKACGISFFRHLGCINRTRKRYKPLRQRLIAVGVLKEQHGVQMATPNKEGGSHFTVWKPKDALIHPDFTEDGDLS
jgi:hypothetical protein